MRKLLNKLLVKFGLLINEDPRSLSDKSLEIGVIRGGSLWMCKEHFDPGSPFVGFDVDRKGRYLPKAELR